MLGGKGAKLGLIKPAVPFAWLRQSHRQRGRLQPRAVWHVVVVTRGWHRDTCGSPPTLWPRAVPGSRAGLGSAGGWLGVRPHQRPVPSPRYTHRLNEGRGDSRGCAGVTAAARGNPQGAADPWGYPNPGYQISGCCQNRLMPTPAPPTHWCWGRAGCIPHTPSHRALH